MKVACVQMRSGLDRAANLAAATKFIREAAEGGAQLIATPEMTNVVDRNPERLFAALPLADGLEEADAFAALATELDVHLLIGSIAVALPKTPDGEPRMANRSYLFGPRGAVATYDKIHLFDVDLPSGESWKESRQVQGGDKAVVATTQIGAIGLSVCYDLRFPRLYRALAQGGAQVLTVPAAFTVPTGQAHWEVLLRARAIETGSFVIAPAQGGHHEDGRETYGHSMMIDPWGRIVAEKPDNEPGLLMADFDLAMVDDCRTRLPAIALDRAFDLRIYNL